MRLNLAACWRLKSESKRATAAAMVVVVVVVVVVMMVYLKTLRDKYPNLDFFASVERGLLCSSEFLESGQISAGIAVE